MCLMNLTLSVDERVVKRARKVAEAMGTSLNQLIRDYLERLTTGGDVEVELEELRKLTREGKGRSRGWKFDREELHERS
jgi:antitoxin component of RelBE/YafQ-DinJ toxin-antitoxin module